MLKLEIPGRGAYKISCVVLDLNGTLTVDGELEKETAALLKQVGEILQVHILTADTLGSAAKLAQELQVEICALHGENISAAKAEIVAQLGRETTIAVGNGENDAGMLQIAAIGIAVLGPEGCSVKALQSADIIARGIDDALMLILKPQRLVAGLRS